MNVSLHSIVFSDAVQKENVLRATDSVTRITHNCNFSFHICLVMSTSLLCGFQHLWSSDSLRILCEK